jgi:hypothetical protein
MPQSLFRVALVLFMSALPANHLLAQEKPEHERLKQETPKGTREKLSIGTLFIPEELKTDGPVPLFIHFHSAAWIPEVAASRRQTAVISVNLGQGSAVYAKPFADPKVFHDLLKEAETKGGVKFGVVGLTAWSAGYGAVRAILHDKEAYERVDFVLLIDGMHAGYTDKPATPTSRRRESCRSTWKHSRGSRRTRRRAKNK